MTKKIEVLYRGRAFYLDSKDWGHLSRSEIEYALDIYLNGECATLSEALEYV